MKRLLPLALVAPLVLVGCDDGADEIASLNQQLEAERVKLTDLETRAAAVNALQAENEKLKADLEVARGEVETARGDVETARGEIETVRGEAFDVKTIEEPVSVAFVRMRETDREIRELRRRFSDDPETLKALGALRTKLGQAGRELGRVAEAARIDLATTVGD